MNHRIVVIGAPTMLELAKRMQLSAVSARCIYFGRNEGDYSANPDMLDVHFIAVYDSTPVPVYLIDDIDFEENEDTFKNNNKENVVALSA
jgi:hypothetical protein